MKKNIYSCDNHYCPKSNCCTWYICGTMNNGDKINPNEKECTYYKELNMRILISYDR